MKISYIFPLLFLTLLSSCSSREVTNPEDYQAYLTAEHSTRNLEVDLNFWTKKLVSIPNQFPYLAKRAQVYTQLFNETGIIEHLINAEEDLKQAIEITHGQQPTYLKILAANYISQHRFKEALELLKVAEANGEKLNGTRKMLFDVHLELGDNLLAESYLNLIRNPSDFDYLIRLSKWEDHNGNLEKAIESMEKAMVIAEASNIRDTKKWTYTNIADFYGHAGDIDKSYDHYLKALELDPNDAYAKKGIAWILYSYENKPEAAMQLLKHVSSYYNAPDYDLLKAEIADYQNDEELKVKALADYQLALQNPSYGVMYNSHDVLLYSEDLQLTEKAIAIAQEEVKNRPTPQSYDLLAWSYFQFGDIEKANMIIENHVDGRTSEPNVLYHVAEIYKAVGKTQKVTELKGELVASIYELGPTMVSKIESL